MNNKKLRDLVLGGLLIAIMFVATRFIQIPIPASSGYFNGGEAVVYLVAILFGRKMGGVVGGLGAALGDLLSGYAAWAPFSLIVKGLEGYVVGLIYSKTGKQWLAVCAGAPIMIAGYAAAAGVLYGIGAVIPELITDGTQCLTGFVAVICLARPLLAAFRNSNFGVTKVPQHNATQQH